MVRTTVMTGLMAVAGTVLAGTLLWGTPTPAAAQDAPRTQIDAALPMGGMGQMGQMGQMETLRGRGRGGPRGEMPNEISPLGALLRQTARLTGLSVSEITAQVRAGSTLAQIAAANGSSAEAVVQAVMADAEVRHARAIENGRMTQAEADQRAAELEQRANELMQSTELAAQIEARITQGVERMSTMLAVRATADVTGLSPRTIRTRMQDGETLAQIIAAEGSTTAAVEQKATEFLTTIQQGLQEQLR